MARQRQGRGKTGAKIPAQTASFRLITVLEVREDWVVETIWTKLHAPHADIEPVSDTRAGNGISCCRDRGPNWPHSSWLREQRPQSLRKLADMSLTSRS